MLSPIFGGTGDVDDPTAASWGGQYARREPERYPNYYADLDADAATCQGTIARWRIDYLAPWRARWQRY